MLEQNDELDLYNFYEPVLSFRLFVSVATKLNILIYQMDVTGAFLCGNENKPIYVSLLIQVVKIL